MPQTDVTKIMTTRELGHVRNAFASQPESLTDLARLQVVSVYPDGAGVVSALPDHFFVPGNGGRIPMAARERERCIIAVLAAAETDPGFVLAVHFYWGLSVGLSPKDIAETLLLVATYAGLPHWTVSIGRFASLLSYLKGVVLEARRQCSQKLGGATVGKAFAQEMNKALSPPVVLAGIRRKTTFASLAMVEGIKGTEHQ